MNNSCGLNIDSLKKLGKEMARIEKIENLELNISK